MGKWKGIRKKILEGNMKIELYNLETDVQEQNDVSEANSEIVKQIEAIMLQEHTPATIERFKMEALGDVKNAKS
jgi:arylsulfatase